jgi:hypothetical protein
MPQAHKAQLGRRRLVIAAAVLTALAPAAFFRVPWLLGWAYYHGQLPLAAQISGHDWQLPVTAARCSNCHDAVSGNGATERVISPLTAVSLTTMMPRRGGPASQYSQDSFCTLLRDGVDPAFVQISRTMPRFEMSNSTCASLWNFVSRR